MPTKQETFDIVVAHLRKQGRKSSSEAGYCVYRGVGSMSCAAGCLIPDEKYSPAMEKKYATETMVRAVLKSEGHCIGLVRALQLIHDEHEVKHWEREFSILATRCKLVYTEPQP